MKIVFSSAAVGVGGAVLAALLVVVAASSAVPGPRTNGLIAFASDRDGDSEIYVMNADGSRQRRLTDNAEDDVYPVWSPNGKRIAFVRSESLFPGGRGGVYIMNADGSGQKRLVSSGLGSLTWSPDGTTIAYRAQGDELAAISVNGGRQRMLAPKTAGSPAWSPDGRRIAFIRLLREDAFRSLELFVMNADGSGQTRLTRNSALDDEPAWSLDGKRLAFISTRGKHDLAWNIYVMKPSGSSPHPLTSDGSDYGRPAWSPDGKRIAFVRAKPLARGFDIYVMNADGSGLQRLTRGARVTGAPSGVSWQRLPG